MKELFTKPLPTQIKLRDGVGATSSLLLKASQKQKKGRLLDKNLSSKQTMLAEGFVLMVLAQIWKKLAQKFGIETGRFVMHLSLFVVALIYSALQYFGYWKEFGTALIEIWAMASGTYEILKTIIEKVITKK